MRISNQGDQQPNQAPVEVGGDVDTHNLPFHSFELNNWTEQMQETC